jgi:hypothetical protein
MIAAAIATIIVGAFAAGAFLVNEIEQGRTAKQLTPEIAALALIAFLVAGFVSPEAHACKPWSPPKSQYAWWKHGRVADHYRPSFGISKYHRPTNFSHTSVCLPEDMTCYGPPEHVDMFYDPDEVNVK